MAEATTQAAARGDACAPLGPTRDERRRERRRRMRTDTLPALVTVGPTFLWMIPFVAVPLVYVLAMSFASTGSNYEVVFGFAPDNYLHLLDPTYLQVYAQSLAIAALATLACLAVGYPFAYLISRTFRSRKTLLYMMVIIPFWTCSLIRIYGWRTFLGTTGPLNTFLEGAGLVSEPLELLYTQGATALGMAYIMFPYMVLPLYSALEKLDQSQIEASIDLGAGFLATIFRVVVPQTMSGVFSGVIMVFVPSLGAFFVSDILGGGNTNVVGNLIERAFQSGNNWPLGAALSIALIVITLVLVKLYQRAGGDIESLGV